MKTRLDKELYNRKLTKSRSEAEDYIARKFVKVNGKLIEKSSYFVGPEDTIELLNHNNYVSRAGQKIADANSYFRISFKDKVALDIGSSTGGFTDYALQNGAKKVLAVDVGSNQLHPTLLNDTRIELHENTDIRDFKYAQKIDLIMMDVSFISSSKLVEVILSFCGPETDLLLMIKPQFEASREMLNKGVVKNDKIRRQILENVEQNFKKNFIIVAKVDNKLSGGKGNVERFYHLKRIVV